MFQHLIDYNKLQGQYAESHGWVDRSYLAIAYRLAQSQNVDICTILVRSSSITESQAREARKAAQLAAQNHAQSYQNSTLPKPVLPQNADDTPIPPPDPTLDPSLYNSLESKEVDSRSLHHGSHSRHPSLISPTGSQNIGSQNIGTAPDYHDSMETVSLGIGASQLERLRRLADGAATGDPDNAQTEFEPVQEQSDSQAGQFAANMFQEGDSFGKYVIREELARGGMGVVFKAVNSDSQQEVALKLILANKNIESVERFQREISVLKKLKHPSIVKLYDYGQEGPLFYYTMELLSHSKLTDVARKSLANGRKVQVLRYLFDLASALEHCHSNGIIHRDVKPNNVVIDPNRDKAVLIDFGIMKRVRYDCVDSSGGVSLTQSGQYLGSPAYMSPEQYGLKGFGDVTERTDVWSFGVTMFQVLTGKSPLSEHNAIRIIETLTLGVIPELKDYDNSLVGDINELCRDCMERNQALRPTMAEVRSRLGQIIAPETLSSQWPMKWLVGAVVVLLINAMIFATALLGSSTAKFLEVKAPDLTSKKIVSIRGEVDRQDVPIQFVREVEGEASILKTVSSNINGAFECPMPLAEGINKVTLTIPGSKDTLPWTTSIVCDSVAPAFEFRNYDKDRALVLVGESLLLQGRVIDKQLATLKVNGETVPFQADGVFERVVEDQVKVQRMTFHATDYAGNTTQKTVAFVTDLAQQRQKQRRANKDTKDTPKPPRPVVNPIPLNDWNQENIRWSFHTTSYFALLGEIQRKRVSIQTPPVFNNKKVPQELRTILNDAKAWLKAGEAKQQAAIDHVAGLVKADLKAIDPIVRSYEGHRFKIGCFRHSVTGMIFHLIPGGQRTVPLSPFDMTLFIKVLTGETGKVMDACHAIKFIRDSILSDMGFFRAFNCRKSDGVGALISVILKMDQSDALDRLKSLGRRFGRGGRRRRGGGTNGLNLPPVSLPPVLICRFEVSEAEWQTEADDDLSKTRPVVNYSVLEVQKWLAQRSRALPMELPSRALWTHACLGFGELPKANMEVLEELSLDGWAYENANHHLHNRSSLKRPNDFGLYNMLGNAEEWCQSMWNGVVDGQKQALWPVAAGAHFNTSSLFVKSVIFRFSGRKKGSPYTGFRACIYLPNS